MPVVLRSDFDAARVREAARESKHARQVRRLLALAAIYDGATRTQAAAVGGVTLQIVRDWVLKFNARGPEGLIDRKAPGQAPRLDDRHRVALVAMIESGPIPAIHGVVRWRIIDLCQWVWDEFQISISKQTLSRELRAMSYRKLSARPRHHAQAEGAIEAFKKLAGGAGDDCGRTRCRSRRHRGLVWRRGADRPKEQGHPPLGIAGNPAVRSARPAHRLDLHLRRHLPEGRQGCRIDPALVQHGNDEPAACGHFG